MSNEFLEELDGLEAEINDFSSEAALLKHINNAKATLRANLASGQITPPDLLDAMQGLVDGGLDKLNKKRERKLKRLRRRKGRE